MISINQRVKPYQVSSVFITIDDQHQTLNCAVRKGTTLCDILQPYEYACINGSKEDRHQQLKQNDVIEIWQPKSQKEPDL